MKLGKHYIDPTLGVGIIIGLVMGAAISGMPLAFLFLIGISFFVGYSMGTGTAKR